MQLYTSGGTLDPPFRLELTCEGIFITTVVILKTALFSLPCISGGVARRILVVFISPGPVQ